jgi:methylenetetrahydrofolate reductase (NADPH)
MVSFEFFPPADAATPALLEHVALLSRIAPDFVSVTYGAGGGRRERQDRTIAATLALATPSAPPPVAHLALAGHTRAELEDVIDRYVEAGVAGVMALRGDPAGGPNGVWETHPGGLTYAVELVELIRARCDRPVGVAAFPYGHPTAPSLAHDTHVLAAKRAAGASFAITQMFFELDAYRALRDRLDAAGLDLPIIPGIMPPTSAKQMARLEQFSGAPLPAALARRLADLSNQNPASVREIGIDWTAQLVQALLADGVPGVHFYTLTTSTATLEVCDAVGLLGCGGLGWSTGLAGAP